MRALLQRVSEAEVSIDGTRVASIESGLLVLLGIEEADGPEDIEWLAGKLTRLRIFSDGDGAMNRSIAEAGGQFLVVSQFTLHASTRKGNRPSFIRAAPPAVAERIYDEFVRTLREVSSLPVQTGKFGAEMKVRLTNDGPVTIWIDTRARE